MSLKALARGSSADVPQSCCIPRDCQSRTRLQVRPHAEQGRDNDRRCASTKCWREAAWTALKDETNRVARPETCRVPDTECAPVVPPNFSRAAAAPIDIRVTYIVISVHLMPVRLGLEPPSRDIVFHFTQHIVEPALRDVPLHLLVILPSVQPRRELGPLFERELFDSNLNLRETHNRTLSLDGRSSSRRDRCNSESEDRVANHIRESRIPLHRRRQPATMGFMACRKRPSAKGRTRTRSRSLGERLYQWREHLNYSQSEAALRLNISTRTLQEWEQGRATPAHLALSAIERIIGKQ